MLDMPAYPSQWYLGRVNAGSEFKVRDSMMEDAGVEVYCPTRNVYRRASRHVRRKVLTATIPAFGCYLFFCACSPNDLAAARYFNVHIVFLNGVPAHVRPQTIDELKLAEAAGAFNDKERAYTIGFRAGEAVLVVVGAFEGRGVIARDTPEGAARVPVEFPSGLRGKFAPYHVHRALA
jgi:Transcription termination factor nusG